MKLKLGDQVNMWSSYSKKLGRTIWIVDDIEDGYSQSGQLVTVRAKYNKKRTIVMHDSDWFVKINK